MKKTIRIISIALCLFLFSGLFAACGDSEPKTSDASASITESTQQTAGDSGSKLSIVTNPTTFKVWWPVGSEMLKSIQTLNDNLFFQELEKKTGVHIDFVHPTVGQEQQLYNLMIASRELPDMVYNYLVAYPGGMDKAVSDDIYIELNDLIEKNAPNYKALMNSSDVVKKATVTDSGNITGFYSISEKEQGTFTGLTVRQDWLNDLGLKTPVTYDDWYNMLKAFKDSKKTESPLMLFNTGFNYDDSLNAGFGVGQKFYQVDGKVKYGPLEQGYKDYLTLMNKWYSEGLINKDFYANKGGNGKSGAYMSAYYLFKVDKLQSNDPKFIAAAAPAPVKNVGDKVHLRFASSVVGNNSLSITNACKTPEIAVKWIDYIYSADGTMLANYGIEGNTYSKVNGVPTFTDVITKNPNGLTMVQAIYKYLLHDGPMNYHWERELSGYSKDELAAGDVWSQVDNTYGMPTALTLTADEGSRSAQIMSEIDTFVMEKNVKFIIGLEPLDKYDDFVNKIKSMKIDEVIKIQQAALDRYKARK